MSSVHDIANVFQICLTLAGYKKLSIVFEPISEEEIFWMNIYFFGYLSDFGISDVGLFGLVWLDIGLIFFFGVFIDHDFVLQHNNAKENSLANIHSLHTTTPGCGAYSRAIIFLFKTLLT